MAWTQLIEKGIISPRILIPTSSISGAFIFLPDEIKNKLSLNGLSKYSDYIGPLFLFSLVLLIIEITIAISAYIKKVIRRGKLKRLMDDYMSNLTRDEFHFLQMLRNSNQDTVLLPFNNPIVVGLFSKRILEMVGNNPTLHQLEVHYHYCVSDLAKKYPPFM